VNNLCEHFSRGQAALVPHLPRRAKNAAHRAADLCGYAQGVALFVTHEHGLNIQVVGQPKQDFFRQLVFGANCSEWGEGVEQILLRQGCAQIAWDVGELRKVLIILLIKTAPDLLGAERLLSKFGQSLRKGIKIQVVDKRFSHGSARPGLPQ